MSPKPVCPSSITDFRVNGGFLSSLNYRKGVGFVWEGSLRQSEGVSPLQEKFLQLKQDRKAVVLAHNYQPKEIQEVADYVGDSLGLSYEAEALEKSSDDVVRALLEHVPVP